MPNDGQGVMDNPYEPPQVADTSLTEADDPLESGNSPLFQDRSFWGLTATQFLGAFNDNLFKQLVLLLAVAARLRVLPPEMPAASHGSHLQSLAMICSACYPSCYSRASPVI